MMGWHPNQFADGRAKSRDDLDSELPDNPAFVQRAYAETFLNSQAMAEMG